MVPFTTICWLAFETARRGHAFKSSSAVIRRSAERAGCAEDGERRADCPATLGCYFDRHGAVASPHLNGLLYSLDTLVPVVDLEVQDFWVPDETVATWARVYLWVHIALGWFLALLAVAEFSGLVQSRSKE